MLNHPIRDFFSLFCHQLASRSFSVGGCQLPLCARCTGLYFAYGIASLVIAIRSIRKTDRQPSIFIVAVLFPILLLCVSDGLIGASYRLGLGNATRFCLGYGAGVEISLIFAYLKTRCENCVRSEHTTSIVLLYSIPTVLAFFKFNYMLFYYLILIILFLGVVFCMFISIYSPYLAFEFIKSYWKQARINGRFRAF